VERLLDLVSTSLSMEPSRFVVQAYATIIEASLHSRGIWDAFINAATVPNLHKTLLLDYPSQEVRSDIAKVISSVCGGALSPSSALTESDTATSFWRLISSVLPHAVECPGQSEQLFDLADLVFRKYDEIERDEASLRLYLTAWSDLLLRYHHVEIVGRGETDFVVLGLSRLLLSCISSLKSFKKPLNAGQLVEKIWNKFLFVPRVVELEDEAAEVQIPVLESTTRKELFDLVLALAEDRNSYQKLLELAALLKIDDMGPSTLSTFDVDRKDSILSPRGYLGLNNPRAICYMNSLLAQLFMNVNFRKFMLGINVADPAASQRLLQETQKLFAMMQNSYRKFADPQDFAACVRVPDGGSIDINIQMDADEFYNLLFDQWEAQMLSPETKQQFRSFYGGQTVNQIKSKECEHVSERLESFFVVQCDVQGKSSLNESLQAFVEGDVMEGENKYKCESCGGKLVDAVKR
jgi:ubiquitin carboxyl-terminal hydrolase 34